MSKYYEENFLCNSYSDELTPIDPEELNGFMAQDDGWPGYKEWTGQLEETERAAALEQYAFERRLERFRSITVGDSRILINRDCNHADCKSSRCSREVRLAGIAI